MCVNRGKELNVVAASPPIHLIPFRLDNLIFCFYIPFRFSLSHSISSMIEIINFNNSVQSSEKREIKVERSNISGFELINSFI
jgi:hypothetical protein